MLGLDWIWLSIGVWILLVGSGMWYLWGPRKNSPEAEIYEDDVSEKDGFPTIHVFCDYNQDEIKTFYEIPDALADLIKLDGLELTFVECLVKLVDRWPVPNKKEDK